MDDDELIVSVARGDDTALRQLFDRHAPWLAARLCKALPPDDVEDVLQETFLAVWKNARTYHPRGAAAGWLWVIARNQAALLLRQRGHPTVPLPDEAMGPGRGQTEDPAEAALTRLDLETAAAAALGPPDGPEREVWRLMYVTGASLDGGVLVLARNVIGITGIGLLTSLFTGGLLAWTLPWATWGSPSTR